jgi:SAM-dependent MidA family methyltransferase
MPPSLPVPGAEALAVSNSLLQRIRAAAGRSGGCLPFDAFMNSALYEPGLGYYSNGLMPFGEEGDFITAPESGALFGACVARCIASVLQQLDRPVVIELGAGSGVLALQVLTQLQQLGCLPQRYCILECSAAMRALQQQTLSSQAGGLVERVEWLDALPAAPIQGVIVGNEVADALPVKRFRWHKDVVSEKGVAWKKDGLSECEYPADDSMQAHVQRLARTGQWEGDYQSEYCPTLAAWVSSLADCLERGLLLLIDYGYGRSEYYHPQRSMGTLICHYRHNAHQDPLWYPGLQDITAFVDFTSIAEAATEAGLRLQGFASQAQFLLASGIDRLLSEVDPNDARRFLQLSNEAKRLMLPGEMGDRFKAIGFSRELAHEVTGFASQDLRSRL